LWGEKPSIERLSLRNLRWRKERIAVANWRHMKKPPEAGARGGSVSVLD
jgi:hypothetical protein